MPVIQSTTLVGSLAGISTTAAQGQCTFSIGANYVFIAMSSDQLTGALVACNPANGAPTSVINASGKAITSGFPFANSWNAGNTICVTTIDGVNYMFARQTGSATVYRGTWDDTNKYFSNFAVFATFSSAPAGANYNSMARTSNTTIKVISQSCYIAEFNCRTGAIIRQPQSIGGTWSPSSYPFSNTFVSTEGYICGASGDGANWYVQAGTSPAYNDNPSDSVGIVRGFNNVGTVQYIHPSNYHNVSYYTPQNGTIYAYANSGVLVASGIYPYISFYPTSTGQNGTIQSWVVPTTATYRIDAYGSRGGNGQTSAGGYGARICGDVALTAGETLKILVGQYQDFMNSQSTGGGGGGGTFVVRGTNTPLMIAGAGGGGTYTSYPQGDHGQVGTSGTAGQQGGGAGGTSGNGGGAVYIAGGGGGLLTKGADNGSCYGGQSFVAGGAGGTGTYSHGGFGGGGGVQHGGGGGGGYSGGGGGQSNYAGGGGGSYNAGTNQINTSGLHTDAGVVVITALPYANTDGATSVKLYSAVLNGTLAFTVSGTRYIEYGLTTSYGTVVNCGAVADGAYSTTITGLTPNTVYNYRAYTYDGTTYVRGLNSTFTTKTGTATLTTQASTSITTTTATANGTITGYDE